MDMHTDGHRKMGIKTKRYTSMKNQTWHEVPFSFFHDSNKFQNPDNIR